MALAITLPLRLTEDGLSRYLQEIRKFPLLRIDQEIEYAKRWRDNQDSEAAYHLVTSHLRLAAKIAMRYRGYGLPMADVVSEANIGLMQAVRRFDPGMGVRLATYAMWWIKSAIHEYVLRSWSIVKMGMSKSQRRLFFGLRKLKNRLAAFDEDRVQPSQVRAIAETMKVTEREVLEVDGRLRADLSLNMPADLNGSVGEWQNHIAATAADPETTVAEDQERHVRRKALASAVAKLDARQRRIVESRLLSEEPLTLDCLASEFGVSRERVRQLEGRAFIKIQQDVRRVVGEAAENPKIQ